ncbi:MAG: class II aldolase/adducin family protein [Elusimicrobiales bacterium]
MSSEAALRRDIAEAGRRLYAAGLVAGADGNISARLDERRILITPSGSAKGFLRPRDMVVTDMEGRPERGGKASSEIKMHLLVYSVRPDARAVVHAHPPAATGYAAAGLAPDKPLTAESVLMLGPVALAPYGAPGTREVVDAMRPYVKSRDVLLMANHGAAAWGATVEQALFRMETLEHIARIDLATRILGRSRPIGGKNLEKLISLREGNK